MDQEQAEQLLFEIKQKFLREIPHPTIIRKQAKSLAKTIDYPINFAQPILDEKTELHSFLENYISELMALKLKVANANDSKNLCEGLEDLWQLQFSLIHKLDTFGIDFKSDKFNSLKMSSPIDASGLLKFLKASQIEDSQINSYLCSAFEQADSEPVSILTESVVRAKKIIDYEQIR